MQEIIAQGKTVAEAVEKACAELGLSSDDVVYEILEEAKSGIFGIGGKPARVRAWVREDEISAKSLLEEFERPAESRETAREEKPEPRREEKREEKHEPRREERAEKKPRGESRPEKSAKRDAELRESYPFNSKPAQKPEPHKSAEPVAEPEPQETLTPVSLEELPQSAKEALEFFKGVAARLGAGELELSAQKTERGIKLIAEGEEASTLIGRHGELMDSLQYLCTLVSSRTEEDYCKISLDVAGYRKKREKTLQTIAQREAARVKRSKYSATLEPMNPYERRIVHSAVQQIDGVVSSSVGEEPYRRVVISLESGGKSPRRGDRQRSGGFGKRPRSEERSGSRPERRPRDNRSERSSSHESAAPAPSAAPAKTAEKKSEPDESLLYKKIEL